MTPNIVLFLDQLRTNDSEIGYLSQSNPKELTNKTTFLTRKNKRLRKKKCQQKNIKSLFVVEEL